MKLLMIIVCFFLVRIIKFQDSSYDTPKHIEAMESQGLQGDTILVEGFRTGSAKVKVALRDPVYKVSYNKCKLKKLSCVHPKAILT